MRQTIDLSGRWDLFLDKSGSINTIDDIQNVSEWKHINVPGCWEQIENDKVFDGPAWYRKVFHVSSEWKGEEINLFFEGVNYSSEIWINGQKVKHHLGGWHGFRVAVTQYLNFEKENELIVRVYKQGGKYPLRENLAGFLPDVGVIFGGIWKPVSLEVQPETSIEDVFISPEPKDNKIDLRISIRNCHHTSNGLLRVVLKDDNGNTVEKYETENVSGENEFEITFHSAVRLWTLDNPHLYTAKVMYIENEIIDSHEETFGMRDIHAEGDQLYLNGVPVYLRGALHWGWYEDHIAPTPSKAEIKAELKKLKEGGFNLVKHCLYVPVKEYFEAANEMGMLIWQELPMWQPEVTDSFRKMAYEQYEQIIREIRNHPSIVLWTLGCELDQSASSTFLEGLYNMAKELTNDALVRDNSGSGECYGGLLKEYADFYDYHFYTDIHFYPHLLDQFAGSWRMKQPWLFGEFCDYDTYRHIAPLRKANGGSLPWWLTNDERMNPKSTDPNMNYSNQEEIVGRLNLPFTDKELEQNSNKSAYIYRKAVVELVRTYQKITGYVLTSIKSNGIATSAIFDDFNDHRHKPEELKRFNNGSVLALTWDNQREWIGGDRLLRRDPYNYVEGELFRPHLFISHYCPQAVENGELTWELYDNTALIESGLIEGCSVYPGEAKELGVIELQCPKVNRPTKLTLKASLNSGQFDVKNVWDFWIFPEPDQLENVLMDDPFNLFEGIEDIVSIPDVSLSDLKGLEKNKIVLTTQLTDEHLNFIGKGGKVLFVQRGKGPYKTEKKPFWRESVQLFYDHPVMNAFPHENVTNLSTYSIAPDCVFTNDNQSGRVPLMDRLDARTFELDHYMFEERIGNGRLIATTLRFEGGLGRQAAGINNNPAGMYMLNTVLNYLKTDGHKELDAGRTT